MSQVLGFLFPAGSASATRLPLATMSSCASTGVWLMSESRHVCVCVCVIECVVWSRVTETHVAEGGQCANLAQLGLSCSCKRNLRSSREGQRHSSQPGRVGFHSLMCLQCKITLPLRTTGREETGVIPLYRHRVRLMLTGSGHTSSLGSWRTVMR